MAALVAVDAAACGRTAPDDMIGLTTYLLDREQEKWRQLYENADRGLNYKTPDTVMARMVFTSILTGAASKATATTILGKLMPDTPAKQALADHATCYPPGSPVTVLEPMVPDRLAEDFLALMIPGTQGYRSSAGRVGGRGSGAAADLCGHRGQRTPGGYLSGVCGRPVAACRRCRPVPAAARDP
jgi:hypothetical protein